ncbi:MAG: Hsp70 family protein [Actinocatenispora sp.]
MVDYGTATTRALLCWPDQRRMPLVTDDGDPHWPSGVFVGGDGALTAGPEAVALAGGSPDGHTCLCRDLKTHLTREHVTIGERSIDPVAGVAAVLHRLAQQAQQLSRLPVTGLTLTTPAGWGPRHRTALRAAAQQAALPEPHLVAVPVAAAWLLLASGTAQLPPGSALLVCDAGWSGFEASLLVRTTTDFVVLATAHTTHAGGRAVRQAVSNQHQTEPSTMDPSRVAAPPAVESAATSDRAALERGQQVTTHALHTPTHVSAAPTTTPSSSLLPISRELATKLLQPIAEQAAQTTASVVDAASVNRADLVGTYMVGGSLTDPVLAALAEQGLQPTPVPQAEFAAVLGAAHTPLPRQPIPRPAHPTKQWYPLPAISAAVAGSCSIALGFQAIGSSQIGGTFTSFPVLNWGEYAMACCCAMLATTAVAHTPTRPPTAPAARGGLRVPRLVYAANAGIVAALLCAAAGVTAIGLPLSIGSYLRWALLPALPIALLASLLGILSLRYPHEAARTEPAGRRRWFPLEATATATLGMILLQIPFSSHTDLSAWDLLLTTFGTDGANAAYPILGHTGSALIGIGTALAATTTARFRLLTVPTAAAITALTPITLTTTLGVAFIAAATLWWTIRTARLLIAVAPRWRPHAPHSQPPTLL